MLAKVSEIASASHESIYFSRAAMLLDEDLGLAHGSSAGALPDLAAAWLKTTGTSEMERAQANLVVRKFQDAERAALAAQAQAAQLPDRATKQQIEALELAGIAASWRWSGGRRLYPQSLEHYQQAASLTDPARDFIEWARVRTAIARLLVLMDQESDAATMLTAVLEAAASRQPPPSDHPILLRTRTVLAYTQKYLKQWTESEENYRMVYQTKERLLGKEHPETLLAEFELGQELSCTEEKWPEADQLRKEVFEIEQRLLGPDHPETLLSQMALAKILRRQGRGEEGAQLIRLVAEARDRTVGINAPESRFAWSVLSIDYFDRKQYAECETIERIKLAEQEAAFTFGNHDTLNSAYMLIIAQMAQDKRDEARSLAQRAKAAAEQFLHEKDSLRERICNVADELAEDL